MIVRILVTEYTVIFPTCCYNRVLDFQVEGEKIIDYVHSPGEIYRIFIKNTDEKTELYQIFKNKVSGLCEDKCRR